MSNFTNVKDFPLLYNQTQRLSAGVPKSFSFIDDKSFLFLNTVDEKGSLGIYLGEVKGNKIENRLIINPHSFLDSNSEMEIPDEIKALKERLRDLSSGISSFQYCSEADVLLFSLASDVILYSIREERIIKTLEDVFLPTLSPNGRYVAVCDTSDLKVFDLSDDKYIKTISQDGYIWGQPDFISAEEMGRYVSLWFSQDSMKLVSLGYNDDEVTQTYIQDSQNSQAKKYRYPFAGTKNPKLLLHEYNIGGDGEFREVHDEYYVDTVFLDGRAISITLNRSQNILSSSTSEFGYESYRHIDLFNIIPFPLAKKKWLHYDIDKKLDLKHLSITNRKVLGTDSLINVLGFSKNFFYFQVLENGFDFIIKRIAKTNLESERCIKDNCSEIVSMSKSPISITTSKDNDAIIIISRNEQSIFPEIVYKDEENNAIGIDFEKQYDINFDVSSELFTLENDVRVLITKPNNTENKKLPLLVCSYGGPSSFTNGHIYRYAISSKARAITSQWIASLGFVVASIDGAGTPIGTITREDATSSDLFEPTVSDQVNAVRFIIANEEIDESKIAIMGWSFGGYLSAACISKHPEIFKAAVVGAPVSDWRYYDTCYSERFIGNPNDDEDAYNRSSLLNKSFSPESAIRLIHGRSDDNVLYVNSEKLYEHLKEQNVEVEFVTIDNATHMVGNANDAAKLLIGDVLFIAHSLGIEDIDSKLI